MVRKRALVTSRDVRGAVMTLLLPILAVAAVLVHSLLHSTSRLRIIYASMLRGHWLSFLREFTEAGFLVAASLAMMFDSRLQSILKVNIDPTAPRMALTLKRFGAPLCRKLLFPRA